MGSAELKVSFYVLYICVLFRCVCVCVKRECVKVFSFHIPSLIISAIYRPFCVNICIRQSIGHITAALFTSKFKIQKYTSNIMLDDYILKNLVTTTHIELSVYVHGIYSIAACTWSINIERKKCLFFQNMPFEWVQRRPNRRVGGGERVKTVMQEHTKSSKSSK